MSIRPVVVLSGVAYVILILFLGCSSSSTGNDPVDLTPPPIPSGLAFYNKTIHNGSATLIWDTVSASDLQGYHVYWLGGSPADTTSANRLFVDTNSAMISDLDYEIQYYFSVAAIDRNGNESGLSVQVNGKPLNTTSPLSPSGVDIVAENIEYPKITVFWLENDEPDLDHYNVYRATNPDSLGDDDAYLGSVTSSSISDITIEVDTAYHYRVTAVDKGGWESDVSITVSDHVLAPAELIQPVEYAYVSARPTFSWEPVNGAISYNIILTTSRIGGEIWNITVDGDTSSMAYNGKTKLISGNTYYWKIGAISRTEINSVSKVGAFVVSSQ